MNEFSKKKLKMKETTIQHVFSKAWESFKSDYPDRVTKQIVITKQSKRQFFCFNESGECITLYRDGSYTKELVPQSIVLL